MDHQVFRIWGGDQSVPKKGQWAQDILAHETSAGPFHLEEEQCLALPTSPPPKKGQPQHPPHPT